MARLPALTLLAVLTAIGCGRPQGGTSDVPVTGSEDAQIYFSSANPGKWRDYKVDHQLSVQVKGKGDYLTVRVEVPLKTTNEHYIEVIVLVDGKNREIAKQTFARSEKPVAEFNIRKEETVNLFAVAKCNQHDMWRTKIE